MSRRSYISRIFSLAHTRSTAFFRRHFLFIFSFFFFIFFCSLYTNAGLETRERARLEKDRPRENRGGTRMGEKKTWGVWSEPNAPALCLLCSCVNGAALFKQNRGGRATLANTRKFDCLGRNSHEFSHLPLWIRVQTHGREKDNFASKLLKMYVHTCVRANESHGIRKSRTINFDEQNSLDIKNDNYYRVNWNKRVWSKYLTNICSTNDFRKKTFSI